MKNERILIADDSDVIRSGLSAVIESYEDEEGHKVVGEASSVREVKQLLEGGLRPTVAIVDGNFRIGSNGEVAARLIREYSPGTKIIAHSSDMQYWGDEYWPKGLMADEILERLRNLQHKENPSD